jgi:hypothetical protein
METKNVKAHFLVFNLDTTCQVVLAKTFINFQLLLSLLSGMVMSRSRQA